jgi:hypothetical protein
MILGGLGARRCDLRVMRRLCPTTSIWTVDLAHLLRRFGVDVTFCTITLGANPDFASEARARSVACKRAPKPRSHTPRSPSMLTPWKKTGAESSGCFETPRRWE